MRKILYLVQNNSICVSYDNNIVSINAGDLRYNEIIKAIRNNDIDKIPDIVEHKTGDVRLDLEKKSIKVESAEMPIDLYNKVSQTMKGRSGHKALLNFWKKLKKNPNKKVIQRLYKFISYNGHPLTEDGNFLAYKSVDANFRDIWSGKFDNSPGKLVRIDRELVDSEPNRTCSHGLHVACWSYLKHYPGANTIVVEVDPYDVVCVPDDYDGTKMRLCAYRSITTTSSPIDFDSVAVIKEKNGELHILKQVQRKLKAKKPIKVCEKHPKYGAVRKPRTRCRTCWKAYKERK